MRSNYRRIWELIHLVDERNKWLHVSLLLWLTIAKKFIPSVANTIWTDMENYKIIRKNQFACSLMQVRRDKRIPVALVQEFDEAIISQAYPIFEVNNNKEILPEYLMMWFSREEFDREACFYAVGWVRGSLEWEDFCNMKLPVPDITKQQEIIDEYNTIKNRISLNNSLIGKLEETAQAVYREWFVDFEFPDENGNPYKSSGGEMEFCEELDKEVPKGWKVWYFWDNILTEIIWSWIKKFEWEKTYLATAEIDWSKIINFDVKITYSNRPSRANMQPIENSIWFAKMKNTKKNQLFLNIDKWNIENIILSTWFCWIKPIDDSLFYIYTIVNSSSFEEEKDLLATWTTQEAINNESLINIKYLIPNFDILNKINDLYLPIYKTISFYKKEIEKLSKMKDLILSKMASEG